MRVRYATGVDLRLHPEGRKIWCLYLGSGTLRRISIAIWYAPRIFIAIRRFPAWFPTPTDVQHNLRALPAWSSRFEIPDIVDYADYVAFPEIVVPLIRRKGSEPEPLSYFPFPKGNGGHRRMCLPTVRDLVLLRAAAGYIGVAVERALTPHVYSSRLASGPPGWSFRANGYKKFQREAAQRAKRWECDLMVRTDVRSYYPSIPIERLATDLLACRCEYGPACFFLERVMWWQDQCGLTGLPVGPEACGVAGAFYLLPADQILVPITDGYYRYTDDIIYFTGAAAGGDSMLDVVDDVLRDLKLQRGTDKTEIHDDPRTAREAIQRRLLASLSNELTNVGMAVMPAVRDAFIKDVLPNPGAAAPIFRWYLRTFTNRSDKSALQYVTSDWDLFNVDPRVSSKYVGECGLDEAQIVDRVLRKLEQPSTDGTDGTDLHLLRILCARAWGSDEGRVFEQIAEDGSRRWPVRAWAWRARAKSAGYSTERAAEAALDETNPHVRRAIMLTLKGRSGSSTKWFLRQIASRYPEHAPTVAWTMAA